MDELHTAQRSERRLSLSNAQQDVLTIDTDLRSPRGSEMSNISPTHSNNPHPANSNATNAPNSNALQSSSATMQPPSAANAKSHHQLSSNVTVSGSTMTNDGKKPLTPRRNGNNSSNSITPMSSISSLHSPNSIAEKIIARKPRSISFYIDLSSNGSLNSTQNSSRVRSLAALQNSKPYRKYKRAPFTSGSAITPNSDEILSRMNARLLRASLKRSSLLQEKRLKLKKRADHIKRKALLQRHKEKLMNLKLKAKTDYAMSAAAIKRQMFLQQRAERSGAKVEHAQNVAMLKRLEKCLHLRKSFSATFAEIVSNSSVLDDLLQDNDDDQQEEPDYTPVSPIKERFNSPLSGRSPRSPLSPIRTGHPIDRELTPLPSPTKLPNSTAINSPLFDTDTNGTTPAITITDDDSYPSPPRSPLRKSQSVPANLFDIEPLKIDIPSTEIEDFLPPITRYTLRELDVQEILSNVQLRHDLIFDPDMQFRPNLEGDRGTQKVIRNQQYWTEVQKEIVEASTGAKPWFRLPLLFMEIREIMSELIPYSKEFEDELDEKFDVELLTQELKHNALNAIGVLEFVAGHLHQYCAPCRDELVDQMVELFKKGEIVESLKKCFEVLEFMKLDFANHHLKKLRPWIIENAAEFEWKCFKEQLDSKTVSIEETTKWLENACEQAADTKPYSEVFTDALINLIASPDLSHPDSTHVIPETFRMDSTRLTTFHNDYQDISIMCSLLLLFRQSSGPKATPDHIIQLKKQLWILLNDSETTMENVVLAITQKAGEIRAKPFGAAETKMVGNLVDKTLSFDSPLFEVIMKRVGEVLKLYLADGGTPPNPNTSTSPASTTSTSSSVSSSSSSSSDSGTSSTNQTITNPDQKEVNPLKGTKLSAEILRKYGLSELEEEILDLAERVKVLAEHNRRTYSSVYDIIVKEWKEKKRQIAC